MLTSRLTQDCLENLFSVVRLKNPPLAFKCALKNISIAQFLKPPGGNHGNYQEDDREFAVDFLSQPVKLSRDPEPEVNDIQISEAKSEEELCKAELNSLFYLVGYCVHSMKKTENVCDSCLQDITSTSLVSHQSATLTNVKEFKKDCLEHVTECTFSMMLRVGMMFRNISDSMHVDANKEPEESAATEG